MSDPSSSNPGWSSCVSFGGLASLGLAGICWFLSKEEGRRASQLMGIPCHEHLDGLRQLKGHLPQLVALRGWVNSNNPKKCELSDKLAVIHELVEEEVWRKERENGRVVNEPFEVKRAVERSEWFLDDGVSSTRVKVENVHQAERLSTVLQASQVFIPEDTHKNGMARFILDKTWHMAKLGVRKTERFLPVGSIVTVIGQLDESLLARDLTQERWQQAAGGQGAAAPHAPTHHHAQPPPSLPSSSSSPSVSSSSSAPSSPSASAPSLPPSFPFPAVALPEARHGLPGSLLPPSLPGWGPPPSVPPLPPGLPHVLPGGRAGQQGQGSSSGGLVVRKPAGGGPFIITPMTLQQLQASMSSSSTLYKYAAMGLGALGVALFARKALMRLLQRWRDVQAKRRMDRVQERIRQRAAAAAAGGAEAAQVASCSDPDSDRAAGTCVICIDRPATMCFTSCGHLCCCEPCSRALNRPQWPQCPVCRVRGNAIRVYRP